VTGAVPLVAHQFRYDQRVFWRDPNAVFFTVALPVAFLLVFGTIFGPQPIRINGRAARTADYMVPAMVTFGVVSATFLNLAISVTISRERGLLKRLRTTPLPLSAFIAARVLTAITTSLLLVVVLVATGRLAYGVPVPGSTLPAVLIALAVGAATFCTLGLALTALIPSEAAAAPMANAIILPLYFISGVFIPASQLPATMLDIASVLPVRPFFLALLTAFDPPDNGPAIAAGQIAILIGWGLAGLLIALRTFRWTPRRR
jgi:ABC-2 type transport system permease protein